MECLQVLEDIAWMDVRGCAEPSTVLTKQSDLPESRAKKPRVYGVLKTQNKVHLADSLVHFIVINLV